MAVCSLSCRSCGTPVEISGRYGFKLKNVGLTTTLCTACRQEGFLKNREVGIAAFNNGGQTTRRQRWIPAAVIALAGALVLGGLWIRIDQNNPGEGQDGLPSAVSPSK